MNMQDTRTVWESAAPGWARWEPVIAKWVEPATEAMLAMAGVTEGSRVLDLACGAGSQTLRAAARVGPRGSVIAADIAAPMLQHVEEQARARDLTNVQTLQGAAEHLDVTPASIDAVICRLGLMLFSDPAAALASARRALRPGGKLAAVVFTTPAANPFMAVPMQILLRHTGKKAPAPGQPGIFALGAPGVLPTLLAGSGYEAVEQQIVPFVHQVDSAAEALRMMQEAFGLYRAVVADSPDAVRTAAWSDVEDALRSFEGERGVAVPGELLVAAASKPA